MIKASKGKAILLKMRKDAILIFDLLRHWPSSVALRYHPTMGAKEVSCGQANVPGIRSGNAGIDNDESTLLSLLTTKRLSKSASFRSSARLPIMSKYMMKIEYYKADADNTIIHIISFSPVDHFPCTLIPASWAIAKKNLPASPVSSFICATPTFYFYFAKGLLLVIIPQCGITKYSSRKLFVKGKNREETSVWNLSVAVRSFTVSKEGELILHLATLSYDEKWVGRRFVMEKKQFSEIRRHLGKTQLQMAQLLGISLKAIQSFEQGWRNIPGHIERQVLLLWF
jgi:DNA-binding transcriptional regulator YiaG